LFQKGEDDDSGGMLLVKLHHCVQLAVLSAVEGESAIVHVDELDGLAHLELQE
jgi:hypothetical protein